MDTMRDTFKADLMNIVMNAMDITSTKGIFGSALERVKHHRVKLFRTHPFFYYLLADVPMILVKNRQECPTMGVGFDKQRKKVCLYWNDEFVNEISDDELVSVIQHEAIHLALCHVERMSGKKRKVWNFAADYKVNHDIPAISARYADITKARQGFYSNPKVRAAMKLRDTLAAQVKSGALTKEKATEQYKVVYERDVKPAEAAAKAIHFAAFWITHPCLAGDFEDIAKINDPGEPTSEDIYRILIANQNKMDEKYGEGDGESSDGDGEGMPMPGNGDGSGRDSHQAWEPFENLSEEERQAVKQHVKNAIKEAQKAGMQPGNLSGEMRRIVEEILKVKKDWRGAISLFTQNARKPEALPTWKKFSRRYGSRAPGHNKDYRPNIVVIIDTSGSIGEELYAKFWGHIGKIAEICESLWVIDCDTTVNFCRKYNHKDKPIPQKGGGGTDMQPAYDYIKQELILKGKERIDGAVNLTDGYLGRTPDTHGIRTLFAISPGGQQVAPEKYKNIQIED